jgi:hypothetical protein
MDSQDFMHAMVDLDNNPDQKIVVGQPVSGHLVEDDGGVFTTDGDFVGVLPDDVFRHRTEIASGL